MATTLKHWHLLDTRGKIILNYKLGAANQRGVSIG